MIIPNSDASAESKTIPIKVLEDTIFDPDYSFIETKSLQNDEYYSGYYQTECSAYGYTPASPLGPHLLNADVNTNKQLFLKFDLSGIAKSNTFTDVDIQSAKLHLSGKAREKLDIDLTANVFTCPDTSW